MGLKKSEYFDIACVNMIKSQLMTNHVHDEKILQAFYEVPRHAFVEGEWDSIAYYDGIIPLSEDRFMLAPGVLGRMISELRLQGSESLLEIACGTGYTSALLSQLVKHVTAVESIPHLAVKAANNIVSMNLNNVSVKQAELLQGAPENGPYDAILVNGACKEVPNSLKKQLAVGGRMVILKECAESLVKAVIIENFGHSFSERNLFDANGKLIF